MNMNENSIIWIAGGCMLMAGVCLVVASVLKKRNETKTARAVTELKTPDEQAISELAANAKAFIGLYEPMHLIQIKKLKSGESVFADWDARVNNLEEVPALNRFWNDVFADYENWGDSESARKASELLTLAKEAGISRSVQDEVTVDRNIFRYYMSKDGTKIEPGTIAKVDTPYWSLGEIVLEKGKISKK